MSTATGPILVQYTSTETVQIPSYFKIRKFISPNVSSLSFIYSKIMYKVSLVSTKLYYFDSELFRMIQLQIIISILYPGINPCKVVFQDYVNIEFMEGPAEYSSLFAKSNTSTIILHIILRLDFIFYNLS